jgi:steroid delta-isomerase-like uncharacterized protein
MTTEERKAAVQRYYEVIWNQGELNLIDDLMAEQYRNVDPATPGGGILQGRAAFRQLVTSYRTTFPDLHFTIEGQIAEGDTVATWWTAGGTMRGALNGMPATGKSGAVTGITISRFAGNRIVEDRVNWDTLGLLSALDLLPQLATAVA